MIEIVQAEPGSCRPEGFVVDRGVGDEALDVWRQDHLVEAHLGHGDLAPIGELCEFRTLGVDDLADDALIQRHA